MDIRKLQRAIIDGLEDVKAQDIMVFNTEHLSALFERVIIASGTSNRQTKALASSVRDKVRSQGGRVLSTEGEDNGEWIIVDCGAAVAHILQPAIRQYYYLEELWGGKPVNIKLTSAPRGLVKASEPMDDEVSDEPVAAPAVKAGARSGAGTAKARKTPAKTAAKAGSRTGAKAAPAKTASRSAGGAAKTSRTGAAKAPARRPAAKTGARTAAGKTTARSAGKTAGKAAVKPAAKAAGKTTARKTAAKKSTGSPRRG